MNKRQKKEKIFWDRFANRYDAFIKNTVDKTYKTIIENIDSELCANQHVLEIGTGTGVISFSICTKVSSILATDLSPKMIQIAKRKLMDINVTNIDFQVQDSYNMDLPDKSFDVVIASNLLHLLYEPEKPLIEVKRVMKDNGLFIAPTFCVGEDAKSKIIATVAGFFSGFKVVNKWSIDEFKSMFSKVGLIIEKILRIDGRFPLVYIVLKKK
jgi:phosphatidylethanolamine/phosphatidyl-N-methylethanolamine N-methyltransferase